MVLWAGVSSLFPFPIPSLTPSNIPKTSQLSLLYNNLPLPQPNHHRPHRRHLRSGLLPRFRTHLPLRRTNRSQSINWNRGGDHDHRSFTTGNELFKGTIDRGQDSKWGWHGIHKFYGPGFSSRV